MNDNLTASPAAPGTARDLCPSCGQPVDAHPEPERTALRKFAEERKQAEAPGGSAQDTATPVEALASEIEARSTELLAASRRMDSEHAINAAVLAAEGHLCTQVAKRMRADIAPAWDALTAERDDYRKLLDQAYERLATVSGIVFGAGDDEAARCHLRDYLTIRDDTHEEDEDGQA